MTMAVLLTDHSLNRIGYYFGGRDHSTVIHASRSVQRRRTRGQRDSRIMRRVTRELMGQ
jgi:chromosomal replication initiator protein